MSTCTCMWEKMYICVVKVTAHPGFHGQKLKNFDRLSDCLDIYGLYRPTQAIVAMAAHKKLYTKLLTFK